MAKRIKSGIKRVEVAERNRLRNVAYKSAVKTFSRHALEAQKKGQTDAATLLTKAVSIIDRCVNKGILHRNTAARKKSKLVRHFNATSVQKSGR